MMGPSDLVNVEKRRGLITIPEEPQWPVDILWIPQATLKDLPLR